MANVATKELLAIDVPCATSEFEKDFTRYWEKQFQANDLAVTRLPHIPFHMQDEEGELVRQRVKESGEILSQAAGLLVINRIGGLILHLDRSNLFHMQQCSASHPEPVPIFCQVPFIEVASKEYIEQAPKEMFYVGDSVSLIKKKLGE